jgi:hypothetical protein
MWRAHIFEDAPVVRNVEEFPCNDIMFSGREQAIETNGEHSPEWWRDAIEPLILPVPGEEGWSKATGRVEARA